MNELKNDTNLREAVSRKEQKLPPMPADLNERLQQRLSSPTSEETETSSTSSSLSSSFWGKRPVGPSGRGRGVRLLLAAAASIALFLVLHYGKEQAPQESVVAQQTVKPTAVPSPSIVEESEPETMSNEQGARGQDQKPVPVIPPITPQATEPTPTDKAETPHHLTASTVLDVTSPKDELFFLASTSYMAAPKNYNDGLVGETESEDPLVLSAKEKGGMPEGWTDVKNWSNSQKTRPQLTKKERRQIAVADAIVTKQWHIDITSMNTLRYGSRTVTPDFYLELRGDTLRSYLPYLGRAYQSPTMSPSIGLNFEESVKQYKESRPKSNKYTQIDIDVRTREDSYHYVIDIYDSGQTSIRVRSMNRDPISFDGTLEIE